MNPNKWHQLHCDIRNVKQTHIEILDENNLDDLVEQEPSDKNDAVSPPQVVGMQRVSGGDARDPVHSVQARGSAIQSTRLIRTENFRVLERPWGVSWDDVVAVAPQGHAHELVVHQSTPS